MLPVAIHLGTTVTWQPLDGLVRVRSLAFGDVSRSADERPTWKSRSG